MISKLVLDGFKSFFHHQELKLGDFSILLGTNASGKSNIGDALRFLHGIARGYTLLEIMNEKRGIGGELIWKGIRGGLKEICNTQADSVKLTEENKFALNINIYVYVKEVEYKIDLGIIVRILNNKPDIFREFLKINDTTVYVLETDPIEKLKKLVDSIEPSLSAGLKILGDAPALLKIFSYLSERLHNSFARIQENKGGEKSEKMLLTAGYRFTSVSTTDESLLNDIINPIKQALYYLQSARFFDLNPEIMRIPTLTGQTVLGEHGENLSSVLHAICEQEDTKANLLEWLGALTPTDATDFKFYTDPYTNKVLAILIESNGQETSLYSASDGTLRFLAILAALFSPTPASLYFFEEIENGIHPSRLYLLVELLEERAKSGIQIIATTHSPQLLSLVSQTTLENSSLIYRTGKPASSRIMPILEILNIKEILEKQDIAKLHATGWFEDMAEFMQEDSQ